MACAAWWEPGPAVTRRLSRRGRRPSLQPSPRITRERPKGTGRQGAPDGAIASESVYWVEYSTPREPGMSRFAAYCALILLGTVGCRSTTVADRLPPDACPQTYEFGNYGCARVLVSLAQPPQPWPSAYRLDVRLRPADANAGASTAIAPDPQWGDEPMVLVRWGPPPAAAGETLSVWVVAKMLEDPSPPVVGAPLAVFAADSVLRVLQFAPVGAVPPTDSVTLVVRTP